MGAATIVMAALLAAGSAAGVALAVTGAGAAVGTGLLLATGAFLLLGLVYVVTDRLAPLAAHARRARRNMGARLAALFYALVPMLVLVNEQIATTIRLQHATPLSLAWLYAVVTGPPTLLAALARRDRATVWSIRAYAGHLSGMALVTAISLGGRGAALEALCLVPAVLPVGVAYVLALADPEAVETVRM